MCRCHDTLVTPSTVWAARVVDPSKTTGNPPMTLVVVDVEGLEAVVVGVVAQVVVAAEAEVEASRNGQASRGAAVAEGRRRYANQKSSKHSMMLPFLPCLLHVLHMYFVIWNLSLLCLSFSLLCLADLPQDILKL